MFKIFKKFKTAVTAKLAKRASKKVDPIQVFEDRVEIQLDRSKIHEFKYDGFITKVGKFTLTLPRKHLEFANQAQEFIADARGLVEINIPAIFRITALGEPDKLTLVEDIFTISIQPKHTIGFRNGDNYLFYALCDALGDDNLSGVKIIEQLCARFPAEESSNV